jgi:hypothetical protein
MYLYHHFVRRFWIYPVIHLPRLPRGVLHVGDAHAAALELKKLKKLSWNPTQVFYARSRNLFSHVLLRVVPRGRDRLLRRGRIVDLESVSHLGSDVVLDLVSEDVAQDAADHEHHKHEEQRDEVGQHHAANLKQFKLMCLHNLSCSSKRQGPRLSFLN